MKDGERNQINILYWVPGGEKTKISIGVIGSQECPANIAGYFCQTFVVKMPNHLSPTYLTFHLHFPNIYTQFLNKNRRKRSNSI